MTTLAEYQKIQHKRYVDFYRSCKEALGDGAPPNEDIQKFVDSFLSIRAPIEPHVRNASPLHEGDEGYLGWIVVLPSSSALSIKPGNVAINFWKFLNGLLDSSLTIAGLGDVAVLKIGAAISVLIKVFSALKIDLTKLEAFLLIELFRECGAERTISEDAFISHILKMQHSENIVQDSKIDMHAAITTLARYGCIRLCDGEISINEKVLYPFD